MPGLGWVGAMGGNTGAANGANPGSVGFGPGFWGPPPGGLTPGGIPPGGPPPGGPPPGGIPGTPPIGGGGSDALS